MDFAAPDLYSPHSTRFVFAGDELVSDSFDVKEIEDGFFYEVEGKVYGGASCSRIFSNTFEITVGQMQE